MATAKNLAINQQAGSERVIYATWDFQGKTTTTTTSSSTSSSIVAGALVSISSDATYYNGTTIPTWVKNQKWYVYSVKGDRVVINKNQSGTNSIMSPINSKYLTVSGSSTSTTTTTTTSSSSNEETWTIDHYECRWFYYTGQGYWFDGTSEEAQHDFRISTYTYPENATKVLFRVTPVSKTYTVNDTETSYWTGTKAELEYSTYEFPPETPGSAPTVEIDQYTLTAKYENITSSVGDENDSGAGAARADQYQFQVYNGTSLVNTGTVDVVTAMASYQCTVSAGGEYRVRARAINLVGSGTLYSDWSDYSSVVKSVPAQPAGFTTARATGEDGAADRVYLAWDEVTAAESYEIQYTTDSTLFDGSDAVSSQSGIETTNYTFTNLDSGDEYFFRLRATNDQGSSDWSEISSVIIGEEPGPPTTWSSATTYQIGDTINLYWVHNSQDGSLETYGQVELTVNGETSTELIQNGTGDEAEDTNVLSIDTSSYTKDTTILWRVRTRGVLSTFGEWSVQRTIKVYTPPTLGVDLTYSDGTSTSVVTKFPFYLKALAGPASQEPIGYHVTIVSNSSYSAYNYMGIETQIRSGDTVYNKYFDTSDQLIVELTAGNIDLEPNVSYTITVLVTMNTGLKTSTDYTFTVNWEDVDFEPDAEIAIDTNAYIAYVTPYCYTSTGDMNTNLYLAVYRREFDGTFTEIATGIDAALNTVVTDPHPALDYARYRIVGTDKTTGSINYYDCPAYPVQCKSVVLQWDEDWSNYDYTGEESALTEPAYVGTRIILPYNIDVSDNNEPDVSLVNYIGRNYPVSYYGTAVNTKATWSMEIPKTDSETLFLLRKLMIWMGDVYVREPSGSGYWANATVSFSQTHRELTIPITLTINRVEGGM